MYTIHDLDRDGNPHRELASTEFADIAHTVALAIARLHWPDDSRGVRDLIPEGTAELAIYEDGKPYSKVILRETTVRRWTVEGGAH